MKWLIGGEEGGERGWMGDIRKRIKNGSSGGGLETWTKLTLKWKIQHSYPWVIEYQVEDDVLFFQRLRIKGLCSNRHGS